jgi:hypothetical protein
MVEAIRNAVEVEKNSSEGRSLKAVSEIKQITSQNGTTLEIDLHKYLKPLLAKLQGDHFVACHLSSNWSSGTPIAMKEEMVTALANRKLSEKFPASS